MKKYLLGAAAALAIVAPGVASAQSGYVDLGFTNSDAGALEIDTTQIGGAYAWGGNGTVGFQIDGVVGMHEYDSGGPEVDTYNIGGHAFVRNDSHLIGGFVNFGNTDFGFGEYDYYTLGAEGAIYMSRTTLNGTLSWSDSEDFDSSITALDLGLTHFVTDNFSVGGNVGFGEIDNGGSDFTAFGVGGEYQFATFPVSLYGGWNTTDYDGFEVDALTLGVRYNFGGTLFDRDRSGASQSRNGGFGRLGAVL
jgi:hypothetical protein